MGETHYTPYKEKVEFQPGETSKQISVELLGGWAPADDKELVEFYVDVFEDAEDTGREQGHEVKVQVRDREKLCMVQ